MSACVARLLIACSMPRLRVWFVQLTIQGVSEKRDCTWYKCDVGRGMVSTSSVRRTEASRDKPLDKMHVPPGAGEQRTWRLRQAHRANPGACRPSMARLVTSRATRGAAEIDGGGYGLVVPPERCPLPKLVFQLRLPSPILYSGIEVLNLSSPIPKTSYHF
jgi:hypothetical protein